MKKTEKKYWVNGWQVRGKNFRTVNFSIGNIGIMLSGRVIPTKLSIYQLVEKIDYKSLKQVFDSDWQGFTETYD